MADIFSKVAKQAKAAKQNAVKANTVKQAVKPAAPVQAEVTQDKVDTLSTLSDKLQKSVVYAAFYAVYQKSGTLYNQSSVDGLLSNVEKALNDSDYADFASNVSVIAEAIASVQSDIISPLSADDIIKSALDESPNESPKEVINKLISAKEITGADARRYLERLLGW